MSPEGSPTQVGRCAPPVGAHEGASVTVLTAGLMVLVCVLALVSVDIARSLQARARSQTAADAAALAAAQEIALPTGTAPAEVASTYAALNGATLLWCLCEPGTTDATVAVSVTVHFVFLGADRIVESEARATVGAVVGTGADPPATGDG